MIRAAYAFQAQGLGHAVLVGREELVAENMRLAGLDPEEAKLEIINARLSNHNAEFVDFLYGRLQRQRLPAPRRAAADQPGPQLLRRLDGRPAATPTAW